MAASGTDAAMVASQFVNELEEIVAVRLYSVRRFWTAGKGVTPGLEDSFAALSEAMRAGERAGQRGAGAAVIQVDADRTIVTTRLVAAFGPRAREIRRAVA